MNRHVSQRVRDALVGYDARQAYREARREAQRAKQAGYGLWYYRNVTKALENKCKTKSTHA